MVKPNGRPSVANVRDKISAMLQENNVKVKGITITRDNDDGGWEVKVVLSSNENNFQIPTQIDDIKITVV